MLLKRLIRGRKSTAWVTALAGVVFVVGAVYMYRIPMTTIASQLLSLLLLFVLVIALALVLAALLAGIKKLFNKP